MDSFDLDRVASQNYMGLTANYRGHPALIVGWDGKDYILESETGRRFKTSEFIWEYETLGQPEIAARNAVIAAWRSEDSPFKDLKVRLAYTAETGEWDAWEVTSGIHLAELEDIDLIAQETDPEFGGDDAARLRVENEAEYEQALADAGYFVEEWTKLGDEIPDDILLDPIVMLLPDIIEAASDPKIDGFANPEIKKFFDTEGESCGCHKGSSRLDKTAFAFLPAIGAAAGLARSLMPAMAVGNAVSGLRDTITPDFAGPRPTLNNAPMDFYSDDYYYAHQVRVIDDHFVHTAADETDVTESMRQQVINALRAVSGDTGVFGEQGDAIWYSLMMGAQKADSVAELQTVLQSIPEDARNANPGIGIADPAGDAPDPVDFPGIDGGMVPGGDVPAEPDGPSGIPPLGDEDVLGGGPLVEDQPVGTAPGGGIPGGPGRRSSATDRQVGMSQIEDEMRDREEEDDKRALGEMRLKFKEVPPKRTPPPVQDPSWERQNRRDFFALLGVTEDVRVTKTDIDVDDFLREGQIAYNPIPGVAPVPQTQQPAQPNNLNTRAQEKATIDQAVQELLNQHPELPYNEAVQRAATDLDIARSKAEGSRPVIAGALFSSDEQKAFIDEIGVARNLDRLNLKGTHYEELDVDDSAILF